MSDSKVSDLTENTSPEARDLFYHADLSESTEADRSKSVSLESIMDSVAVLYNEIVVLNGNIVTV